MCDLVDFVFVVALAFVLALCFLADCVVAPVVDVVAVVPVVVPVVPVVVPVPLPHGPMVSPWLPMCAGKAFLLISIVTPGFFFDPVL